MCYKIAFISASKRMGHDQENGSPDNNSLDFRVACFGKYFQMIRPTFENFLSLRIGTMYI